MGVRSGRVFVCGLSLKAYTVTLPVPEPRESQIGALELKDRIRIVRAVPGSGKTWLLAEVLRRELSQWTDSVAGIAALSFTNVAGDEVRRALGYDPGAPHFVGTLDSFLYRAIVRPFARWVLPGEIAHPHLVPAEYVEFLDEKHWGSDPLGVRTGRGDEFVNVFGFTFFGQHECGTPSFIFNTLSGVTTTWLSLSKKVLARKKSVWASTGRMSHSDVAYIAMRVLSDKTRGREVVDLLLGRFPLFLVDELQDTGRYHSLALRRLLVDERCRAFVVGDPDQAIYGFNGAEPIVFDHFRLLPGVGEATMDVSDRCAARICTVASALSCSGQTVVPREDAPAGRAVLLIHDGDSSAIAGLADEIAAQHDGAGTPPVITILARRNDEIDALLSERSAPALKFGSPSIEALFKAVRCWRSGKARAARAAADAALGRILFRTPNPGWEDLESIGISALDWRDAAGEAVLLGDAVVPGETVFAWGTRMQRALVALLTDRGWLQRCSNALKPKAPFQKSTSVPWPDTPRVVQATRVRLKTVHGAKGETHNVTFFYVPRPRTPAACPAETWWSDNEAVREEQRIAFVAATRPTDMFVLCVHRETYTRLLSERAEFVSLFDVADVTDDSGVRSALGITVGAIQPHRFQSRHSPAD